MTQVTENLRFLLWKARVQRREWAAHLASWVGCTLPRARELLEGTSLSTEEQERIAHAAGVAAEDLQFARLLDMAGIDLPLENLRYLLDSVQRGHKGPLATRLGIHPTTISNWYSGRQKPRKARLDRLRHYCGLEPSIDLATESLFLSDAPHSDKARKEWLYEHIELLDADTLRELFPAFQRLLEHR
jgi:transcriptional regulator with XRE-family HTH domain